MTERSQTNFYGTKYRVHNFVKFQYSDIGEYIDENHTDRPLRNDILVDLLNELDTKCSQLEKEKKFLKDEVTLLKIKLKRYEDIMGDFDISNFDELVDILKQGCGV